MKKLNNPTENFVSKRINQRRVRRWVALLSALVLFLTVNTLKLEADTLERIATCGIEQHVHDESCYDASGALICGLAEHAHTDACFQQRPQRHDLTRVDGFMPLNAKVTLATPMPRLTSNSANGQDAEQVDIDYYSDIPTEVGSGIEPPVDEIQTELAGEEAAPAVEDAVPLEIVYEDQVEETVQQPEYVINGSTVLLSDILSVLGMKVSGIHSAGELEGDTLAETPVNFAVEATQNDYELRVLRDFDAADLAVMTDDEVIIITLKNGIAPVEDNDDENPSENDDINIEETHTGETDDEAAAEETVDEETEDSADEATVDELTEDTDDAETEETADETTVDATEEETVETVEETETAAVVPDKLVALDFADYDCLADATVYFYAPDRGAVLVNAEELAEADGVHLTVNAPVVLSMEADLGLAELEAALEEAPEDIDVRIGENPVLFENGVLIISGDGELTVNGVTYSVTNVTLPSRSVESDNIIISTVDDQATLLGVTPAFEDNGEDEGDIYALFAAQMDENIVTATSEEIQIDAIEPAKGLLRSSAMMAAEDAAPEAEEAVADAEETVEETAETETAEAAVETRTLKVRVYDVSLIREGESVEPDAPIHVETTFDAPLEGENFQLYHIVDGKPEEVDGFVKTDDQGRAIGMSFDTASLSPFAVVYYTVEYTTTNNVIDVKLDFTDIVKNGVDFDTNSVITALNDGVSVSISELEQGYIEGTDSVVNGELYIDYTTADNKNENIKNVNWIGFKTIECSDGLNVVDGKIKVTKDGTVVLSDGISTVTVVISNYEKLVAKELTSQGVDITVLNGEVPAGSEVSYTALDEAKTSELVEQYNIDSDVEGVAHTAFDVSIAMPEGGNYAESGEFAVTVDLPVDEKAGDFKLYHIHEGQVEELPVEVVDGKVLFTTSSFSEFVLSYTVDFEYNGYKISMPGGGVLLLSELFEQFHIEEDVADVVDVTFTDYDLLKVERVEEDTEIEVSRKPSVVLSLEEADALEDGEAIYSDEWIIEYKPVHTGDWILTSLKKFSTYETLTVNMRGNQQYIIDVQDDAETITNPLKLQDISSIHVTAANSVTNTELERDASFDMKLSFVMKEAYLEALKDYLKADENNPIPAIEYDLSEKLADSPITLSGGTKDLKDNGKVIGQVTVTPEGKLAIQYNDREWLLRKSALGGNTIITAQTHTEKIKDDDSYTFTFPGTSDTIPIHYKGTTTVEKKTIQVSGDAVNGYVLSYTAKFTNTKAMDKLEFSDFMEGKQIHNIGKLTITGPGINRQEAWGNVNEWDNSATKTITIAEPAPAGEYTVVYSASITAEQLNAMKAGDKTTEKNTASWKVNGTKDVPGGSTTWEYEKPKPDVSVSKTSDKKDQELNPGDEITYTVTFGDSNTDLANLQIIDKMTDLQTVVDGSMSMTIGGQSVALPNGFLKYTDDGYYSRGDVYVFDYKFADDDTRKGPVVVTYKTKLISQDQATANGIYEGVTVNNVGQEGWKYHESKTTSTVTYDKEVIHEVAKGVEGTKNADGHWVPGETLTYTIKVGDGTTNLKNARIIDQMTDLQTLVSDTMQIKYGDDGQWSPLTEGIKYTDDGQYSTNNVDVLDLVLSASAGYGPVYIQYQTKVVELTPAQQKQFNVYEVKAIDNTVNVGKSNDGTHGTTEYPEEVKYPLEKDVTTQADHSTSINGQNVQPGEKIHYTVSFGNDTLTMDGVKVLDTFTDIQKLTSKVKVKLSHGLAEAITLQDGTVVEAGATEFYMPTATGQYEANGVVWAAYYDDGKYSADTNNPVRVFYYTLPAGIGLGPVTIEYDAEIINAVEAKENGIMDTKVAYNNVEVDNNRKTTVVYPEFEKNVPHNPLVTKKFASWDQANKRVYWTIEVDKEPDSGWPIEDLTIIERLDQFSIKPPELGGSTYFIHPSEVDMLGAVVTTESGVVLTPGVDYTIFKGMDSTPGEYNQQNPYFHFDRLDEKVTILLSYSSPYFITNGYVANNKIEYGVNKSAEATETYTSAKAEISKSGIYDEDQKIIRWQVKINPAKVTLDPTEHIYFEDTIPEGLELLPFDASYNTYYNNGQSGSKPVYNSNGKPSIKAEIGGNTTYSVDGEHTIKEVTVDSDNKIGKIDIQFHYNPNNVLQKLYPETDDKSYCLSGNVYTVTYFTKVKDEEWNKITSSLTGSLDYENHADVDYGGEEDLDVTAKVTVTSSGFINKYDDTQMGNWTEVDENDPDNTVEHSGIVVDEDGHATLDISYRIEINPNGLQLNYGNPLTLTDRIDTNMEFKPSSLELYEKTGTTTNAETGVEEPVWTKINTEIPTGDYANLVITYDDDTRNLTISGLPDGKALRLKYKNAARAQGQDSFVNTATLIGGGSHSSTVEKTHKIETISVFSQSAEMNYQLNKIDSNNISKKLDGVKFEVYKLEIPEDVLNYSKAQWQALMDDIAYIKAYPGTAEANTKLASIRSRFAFKNSTGTLFDKGMTDSTGILAFPADLKKGPQEKTVYYWVETENPHPEYRADNDPHYFVLYPEEGAYTDDNGDHVGKFPEAERIWRQKIAWALDDAIQYANDVTVASMASGVSWNVTNIDKKYTSISAGKVWEGDSDNFFESRPKTGIILDLYRRVEGSDEWVKVDERSNVNVQPTVYSRTYTENYQQKTERVEEWPSYVWNKLEAYADAEMTQKYYYKVVERPVENYTVSYSSGEEGITEGSVTVTNTFIPPTTNITVHKTFSVEEGAQMPTQVVMELYRYTKSKAGVVTGPEDYDYSLALNASNNWTATFKNLPTRDSSGNSFSYEVREDMDVLESAGFHYTVEYEWDGQVEEYDQSGALVTGLVSGTVEVTNHGPGSLKIQKNVTINGKTVEEGDTGMDGDYTFHILKDGVEITDTYENESGIEVPKSPVTVTITNGVSNSVVVDDLAAGEYTIHEDVPDGMTLTSGNDVTVKVVGGVTEPTEVQTAEFTNNTEKVRAKVEKSWINANRDVDGNIIKGVNNEWPRGVTVSMKLRKTNGTTTQDVPAPSWYNGFTAQTTWNDTVVLNAARQSYIFDNLDELPEGWSYTFEETINDPENRTYQQYVNPIDEDGAVKVINAEETRVEIIKKWENTKYDATSGADKVGSDYIYFNRAFLSIDVKLHRYYMKDGVLTETPYTTPEDQAMFNKTITMLGDKTKAGASSNETTTAGDDAWKLVWDKLPSVGEVDGKFVSYIYKAEEEKVWFTGADGVKQDVTDKYLSKQPDDLTIANRYDKDTSVEVEKVWSDGNGKHVDHTAEFTLYRSKIGPDGTGTPYTGNIKVNSWKLADGSTAAAATTGSITATVKKVGAATGTTYTLDNTNGWNVDVALREGYDYEVSFEKEGTSITSYTYSSDSLTKDAHDITLDCVVPPPEFHVTFTYLKQKDGWDGEKIADIYETMGTTTVSSPDAKIRIYFWNHTGENDVNKVNLEGATVVSESTGTENIYIEASYGSYFSDAKYKEFVVSGIEDGAVLSFTAAISVGNIIPDYGVGGATIEAALSNRSLMAPLRRLAAAASVNPGEVEVPNMPAANQLEQVDSTMVTGTITNPVNLTFSENAQVNWKYSWTGLPEIDSIDGEPWFYYVKETGFDFGSDDITIEDVQYDITYSDVKPRTVTKVKVTNVVKEDEGKLEVTKNAPGIPASDKQKVFRFTVTNEDGLYVQKTNSNEVSAREKWFEIKTGQTITFDPLIVGKYTVTEDASTEAAGISGYKLVATGGGEVTVEKNGTASSTLTNTYTEEKGSLKVAKTFNGLTYDQLTPEQKQALEKVYFTVKNASNETIAMIYLKVDESNMDADLTKTISNLKPGAYTVTEAIPNDSVPSGYEYKTTTVNVTGGTGTSGDKSATATVEDNKTVTVTFDNEYDESTADLTVTKNLSKANTSGSDLTFYVGLFTDSQGTALATQTDVGGTNPQEVTVSQNQSAGTVTFTGLTIGTTYYVFETNASGVKVSTTDKVSGYAIKASDAGGKTVTIAPSNNTASITNDYSASGKAQLSAKKASNDTLGNRKFTFVQEAPNGTKTVSDEVTAGNSVRFPEISFDYTDLGTTGTKEYVYKIYETIPDNAVKEGVTYSDATDKTGTWVADGVSYDGTIHSVTIKVTDKGDGTLMVKYNGSDTFTTPEFNNSYEATGTETLVGTKTLTGGTGTLAAGTFSFIATADASNPPVITTGWHSAPSNEAGGKIDFGSLTFNQVGTWKYTIKENTTTQSEDMIYDLSEYEVTFTTTDNGDGTLSVAKTIKKVKDANGNSIDAAAQATQNDITVSFTNVKKGALKVKKNVTVNTLSTDTTVADGTYNFTLTKKDDSSFQARTITVTVSDGRSAFSNPVENLVPGTYVVTETLNQNGTTLTGRTGGTLSGNNAIEIEVTAGETAEQNVAEFTNDKTIEGKITIKKSVTITPSEKAKNSYKVTVKNVDGKYVSFNETSNKYEVVESNEDIFLNVPVDNTGLFIEGLPIDTYTVTEYENDAQIDGYTLSAESVKNGTAVLTITDNEREVKLNNTYTRDEGSLKIKKTGKVNGAADTSGIIDGEYSFTVAGKADTDTAGNVVNVKITLTNGAATDAEKVGDSVPADVTVTFADGIVTLGKLPTGSYIVTENLTAEQTNAGIHLLANNDIEISVTKEPETIPTAEFENTKSEKGKITVNKSVLYNGVADTEVENKAITVGLYKDEAAAQPVKHTVAEAEVNWTETITLNGSGTGTATFSELDYGTYYVFELGDDKQPVKSTSGTINGVAYTVDYDGTNGPLELNHNNQSKEVNITNKETEVGSLVVTKEIQVDGIPSTAQSGTFKVALYKVEPTPSDPPAMKETIVGEPETITVTNGMSNAATFNNLVVGDTYKVYEVTVDDTKNPPEVNKVGEQFGIYTVSYDKQEVTIPRGVNKDVTGTKVINNIKTTEITALKQWAGSVTPPSDTKIVLTLYKGETEVSSITLDGTVDTFPAGTQGTGSVDVPNTADRCEYAEWAAKWTGLTKYDEDGNEIDYVVQETSYKIEGVEQIVASKTADTTTETNYDFYFTNELPKITINGGKTWVDTKTIHVVPTLTLTRKSAKQDSPTVTLRAADEANKTVFSAADTSANTGVNLQPVWTDLNYSYFDLPKYDAEGYLYTYTVTEDPIENYRSAAEPSGDSSGFGKNFINTELTKIEADKEWLKADGVTTFEPEAGTEIGMQLVRYLTDGVTKDDSFTPVDVTLHGTAAAKAKIDGTDIYGEEKAGWQYEWTELVKSYIETSAQQQSGENGGSGSEATPKDYVYKVEEFKIKYGSGTDQVVSDGISADHNFIVSYAVDQATGKTIITNRENKTKIHLEKKWYENEREVNTPTIDPDINSITIQLWRKNGTAVQLDANTGRLPGDGVTELTRTLERTAKPGTDPVEYTWSWDIENLEKSYWDNGELKDYIYYVLEDAPNGWSVTYTNDVVDKYDAGTSPDEYAAQRVKHVVDGQSGIDAATLGEGTITLKNSKYSVSLPSTGGPGTTGLYVVGSILTLLALVLLITKKRTEGQGID